MLKLGLCDYSDAYIFAEVAITITGAGAGTNAVTRLVDQGDKKVIFKNFHHLENAKMRWIMHR